MSDRPNSTRAFKAGFEILSALAKTDLTMLVIALVAMVAGGFFDGVSIIYVLALLNGAEVDASGQYHVSFGGTELFGWQVPSIGAPLGVALVIFLALLLATIFLMRFRAVLLNRLLFGFTNKQRLDLFTAISRARWQDIQTRSDSDIEHALTGEIDRITGCVFNVLNFIQATVFAAIYIAFGLAISWQMMCALLAVSALLWVSMAPFRKRSLALGHRLQEVRGLQYKLIARYLASLKPARASNTSSKRLEGFKSAIESHTDVSHSFASLTATAQGAFQFGAAVAVVLFLFFSLQLLDLPIAEIIILLVVLARVAMRVQTMQSGAQMFLADVPAWNHIQHLIGMFQASAARMPKHFIPVPQITDRFTLEDVSFSYDTADEPALADLSVVFEAKRITALVGPSGSGKSTLVDLLLGLLENQVGQISLDGVPMRAEMFSSWRDQISYVGQEPALTNGTVRENLLASLTREPSDAEIKEALDFAAASEFVAKLPRGLDEPVGERGTLLSGGQRQRIALATGMLAKRPVLILDEATSALDWESQVKILDGLVELAKAGKTIILVAHRPSVVLRAHSVYVLERGRIVESGPVAKLASATDSYLSNMIRHEGQGD